MEVKAFQKIPTKLKNPATELPIRIQTSLILEKMISDLDGEEPKATGFDFERVKIIFLDVLRKMQIFCGINDSQCSLAKLSKLI